MEFEQCREILLKESELVLRIAGLHQLINEAVIHRNWTDFEGHFNALGMIKAEFTALEQQRETLFAGASFYTFAARLPAPQRAEVTAIYRSLKLETLRVQMAGDSLMAYISGARSTLTGFFKIAFPDRGGKIYTPHGVPVSHDMRSMVLNQTF